MLDDARDALGQLETSELSADLISGEFQLKVIIEIADKWAAELCSSQEAFEKIATAVEDSALQLLQIMEHHSTKLLERTSGLDKRASKNILDVASEIDPYWDQAADGLVNLREQTSASIRSAVNDWTGRFPPSPGSFVEPSSAMPLMLETLR
ncbi:MAG: hypothetical protein ACRDNF_13440 [Streptosporangiaceae bacterium]